MIRLALVFVVLLCGQAFAQGPPGKTSAAKPKEATPQATQLVSRAEFFAVCERLALATDRVLNVKPVPSQAVDRPKELVTRSEVIRHMGQLLEHYRPRFRATPRPTRSDPEAIRQRNPAQDRPLVEKLVAWGLVTPVGPLVVGPGQNMTPSALGDALGYYFSQVSFLSHRADPKWTPRLQPLGGG